MDKGKGEREERKERGREGSIYLDGKVRNDDDRLPLSFELDDDGTNAV